MLTRKQLDLLSYISDYIQQNDHSPSFDEMKEALGLKSKSGIHRLILALEERGFIRRLAHKARALEVVKTPDEALPERLRPEKSGSNIVSIDSARAEPAAPAGDSLSLPLLGRIAAGLPIEAMEDPSEYIDIPLYLTSGKGDHYCLEVSGDSMIEEGILDGDIAVLQRCDDAPNGTIIVALVEQEEATLKTIRREGGRVSLVPANRHYETRHFAANEVSVQGRLTGVMRKYS